MAWISLISVAILGIAIAVFYRKISQPQFKNDHSIFEFTVNSIDDGEPIELSAFRGKKAYLVVNVASKCGLTDTNYAELQELYEKLSPQGLEILAFPCNNFGNQEPGNGQEILSYAREVKAATFPVLGKLECDHGEQTHPLYAYLKTSLDGGLLGSGLKWNFAKFLCDANGVPVQRFGPLTSPSAIEQHILPLLQ
eukprot:gene2196-2396_t